MTSREQAFLHAAGAMFGGEKIVRPYFLDAMTSGAFVKSGNSLRLKFDKVEETWDQEHGVQMTVDGV